MPLVIPLACDALDFANRNEVPRLSYPSLLHIPKHVRRDPVVDRLVANTDDLNLTSTHNPKVPMDLPPGALWASPAVTPRDKLQNLGVLGVLAVL
jgi:hypothetical protein